MRKIDNKTDWDKFCEDVRFNLQENVIQYRNGYFSISQDGCIRDAVFMSDPDFDEDETYVLRFCDLTGDPESKWRLPNRFWEYLLKRYQTPFFIMETGQKNAKYDWL